MQLFLKKYGYKIKTNDDKLIYNFNKIFNIKEQIEIKKNIGDQKILNWINDSRKFIKKHENKILNMELSLHE